MANEFTWRKPKAGEDEQELLRQQEEFLRTKQQLCTKLESTKRATNVQRVTTNVSKVKSQFSNLRKIGEKQDVISTSQGSGDVINSALKDKIQESSQKKLEDVINSLMVNQSSSHSNFILGNIVEKKFDIEKHKFVDNHVSATSELGFPKVFRSDNAVHVEKVCCIYEIYCRHYFHMYYTIFLLCRRPVVRVCFGKNCNLSEMLQRKFKRQNLHAATRKTQVLQWMIK